MLASLPDTIVRVDADHRVLSVNRPSSVVFRRPANNGDIVEDLLEEEAAMVTEALLNNARVTGVAMAEHHNGGDIFRITAKRLESVPETLLVFRNITAIKDAG